MRILGIDFGEKRVGIAVSDIYKQMAFPHEVIQFKNTPYLLQALTRILKDKEIDTIVLGLPKTLQGTIGIAAEGVINFKKVLEQHFSLPIILWDERLSSKLVEKQLIAMDVSRKRRKETIDALAAQVILQGYLDKLRKVSKE